MGDIRQPVDEGAPGSSPHGDEGPGVSTRVGRLRRWTAEQKAQIVRESFWPGHRVSDVAERYGLTRKQLSAWRTLARRGKLAVPSWSGSQPESVAEVGEPEPEPGFATLEVDPAPEPGVVGSVSIEARGVTVRLDGDIGAVRIAEIASLLRALR